MYYSHGSILLNYLANKPHYSQFLRISICGLYKQPTMLRHGTLWIMQKPLANQQNLSKLSKRGARCRVNKAYSRSIIALLLFVIRARIVHQFLPWKFVPYPINKIFLKSLHKTKIWNNYFVSQTCVEFWERQLNSQNAKIFFPHPQYPQTDHEKYSTAPREKIIRLHLCLV